MTSTDTAERAGRWLRVSTKGQDEENQVPDVDGWITDHGYTCAETYRLRGKSASKGKQDAELDRVISDMQRGHIAVLIVWQSSRIERRGAYSAFDLARRVREAGGRIEYVKDAYLNDANDMSDVMLALAATKDRKESQDKSERIRAAKARIRANGALDGRAAWGYAVTGDVKYGKRLVPTDEGRRLVPLIYRRIAGPAGTVAAGETLTTVAAWLADETGRVFWPRTIAAMVRNPVYRGSQQDAAGREIHKCEALVTGQLWADAVANLNGRPGRGSHTAEATSLSSVLRCIKCSGPMYKIVCGSGNQARVAYYRCSGTGPIRKSACKNMVKVADADQLVDEVMGQLTRPVIEWRMIKGHNHKAELEDVRLALSDLPNQGLSRVAKRAEEDRLWAEEDRLRDLPAVPDTWVPVETGETYAGQWAALAPAARRGWLKSYAPKLEIGREGTLLEKFAATSGDFGPLADDEARTVHTGRGLSLTIVWKVDQDQAAA